MDVSIRCVGVVSQNRGPGRGPAFLRSSRSGYPSLCKCGNPEYVVGKVAGRKHDINAGRFDHCPGIKAPNRTTKLDAEMAADTFVTRFGAVLE